VREIEIKECLALGFGVTALLIIIFTKGPGLPALPLGAARRVAPKIERVNATKVTERTYDL
jgi:hypothetical protein